MQAQTFVSLIGETIDRTFVDITWNSCNKLLSPVPKDFQRLNVFDFGAKPRQNNMQCLKVTFRLCWELSYSPFGLIKKG